ncbi:MAG TPA: Asp-tRNA(Asn)/Glu-tRNA(Gln) amidotransferase subunit GatC [Planctomycetota bacterium]|jgi:aspartyl-tRNA(Asn)/glutamyl-tRNA(Gln) amidotransferase subunit C|nr:Asp-tRNA(Asn)/Glu-tRNA(Gln) amidotransferase subunit GatC [Planctomycetota bacterium]
MALDPESLRRLAHLARLRLSDAELAAYGTQVGAILEHLEELKKLDVANVPPLDHAVDLADVRRADEPRPGLSPEAALANAPATTGPFFTVPRILDLP